MSSDTPWLASGRHWVSPFNFSPSVVAGRHFPDPLVIFDSTIRKILYTPGVTPSVDDVLKIAAAIDELGVRQVLLNLHWWGEAEPERVEADVCRAILGAGFRFETTVFVEAAVPPPGGKHAVTPAAALDCALDLGAQAVELTFRVPEGREEFLQHKAAWSTSAQAARDAGMKVALSIADAPRADFDFVVEIANEAIEQNVDRILIMDSYSSLAPDALASFCDAFQARLSRPVQLAMHIHNDFGMGTALAVASAASGVNPDVSINSYSYRGGFAALEEVAVALEVLYGVNTGLRLELLQKTADLVADTVGLPIYPIKAITGRHAFLRDIPGAMLTYLREGDDAFPTPNSCISPSIVGSRMKIVWGHHHSSLVVRAKLEQMGLDYEEQDVVVATKAIEEEQRKRIEYPQWLSDEEVEELLRSVVASSG